MCSNQGWSQFKKNWNWSIQFRNWSGNWNLKKEFNWNWFFIELELNEKELSIRYIYDAAKDVLQTAESIAVQPMVFNDHENLDNEAAGQT